MDLIQGLPSGAEANNRPPVPPRPVISPSSQSRQSSMNNNHNNNNGFSRSRGNSSSMSDAKLRPNSSSTPYMNSPSFQQQYNNSSSSSSPPGVSSSFAQPQQAFVLDPFYETADRPEVRLASTLLERMHYDDLCDFYALLVATERLETAYVRDSITAKQYTKTCNKLIAQYRTMREKHKWDDGHIQTFLSTYKISTCKAAAVRLSLGIPATLLYGGNEAESKGKELIIFQCVQTFITTMDSLKLDIRAVDELFPGLRDLVENLNRIPELPRDHEVHTQVQKWLGLMAQMRATDELTDDQARQMAFDLDSAYGALHRFMEAKSKAR
jgi:ESCRT-I complex subunit VPS28